ncbi:sulfur carrier protein ThiS [Porphyromonas sp.]|uniref:sulfur carrier protein ThiS n=1 Tax=Porphyromonas sp. TaxID=1924944 RepID=UPI0026DC66E9|nr:sulfur carrier protein ThiS [Porphyromonas sp.]MDO4695297.1 sulfur carrier protein ThiS [Porphyromonas sp.]MDO4771040.1 sulfur carrier protein ThiS [Porphyromonas sp.]
MLILLNKQSVEIPPGTSLQSLAVSQGIESQRVAIAVNMQVIRRDFWAETILSEGDSVTIIGISKGG